MKNRVLTLLTVTMLTGSLLVGCGGNETGADNGGSTNTEANVNSEADVTTDAGLAGRSDIDLSLYTEYEYGYYITDEANYGAALVDGEELQNYDWEYVNKYIQLTDTVDTYSYKKYNSGFLKSDIVVVHSQTNGEWSTLGMNIGDTFGIVFVKTAELTDAMEVLGDYTPSEDGTEESGMSDRAAAFFDRLREGIDEDNKILEEAKKQYPNDSSIVFLEEVGSSEGLELMGTFNPSFNDMDNEYETIMAVIRTDAYTYTKYCIEYVSETKDFVTFNFYIGK